MCVCDGERVREIGKLRERRIDGWVGVESWRDRDRERERETEKRDAM